MPAAGEDTCGLAVAAHVVLGSLAVVTAVVEMAEAIGPLSEDLAGVARRHLDRLDQFLTLLTRGRQDAAVDAIFALQKPDSLTTDQVAGV